MKINFKFCGNLVVFTSQQTEMRQKRAELLELKDIFPASFIMKQGLWFLIFQDVPFKKMFFLWEGPNGSPVRQSKLMRAKWRWLSSVRHPQGRWGRNQMICYGGWIRRCFEGGAEWCGKLKEGSGWPVTTHTAPGSFILERCGTGQLYGLL